MSHHILPMVERFLRESDMPPSVFGREAVKDPRLVSDLRAGREVGSKLRQRVADYIDQWRQRKTDGTVHIIGDRRTFHGRCRAEAVQMAGDAPPIASHIAAPRQTNQNQGGRA